MLQWTVSANIRLSSRNALHTIVMFRLVAVLILSPHENKHFIPDTYLCFFNW